MAVIKDTTKTILISLGINPDKLSSNEVNYIIELETIFNKRMDELIKLKTGLRDNRLTFSALTDETSFSRQTLYNNPTLKQFASCCIETYEKDNPVSIMESLKLKITDLKDENEKMHMRDIQELLLKQSVTKLQEELTSQKDENLRLQGRYSDLLQENLLLKNKRK